MIDTGGPDGVRLHAQRLAPPGGGPPAATVVLLHGLLVDSLASYYFTVAPGLAAAGLDVVMYDLRGHGRSERPATGYRLRTQIADLERLLHRLEVAGPVHLVGNSFGGTIAFGYAVRHPDRVAGLTLVESEPATPAWAVKLRGLLGRVETELAGNEQAALDWLAATQGPHLARVSKGAARLVRATRVAREVPDSEVLTEEEIRTVRQPVLAVYGSESDLGAQGPWLRGLLPRCRTVVLPGLEHSVLVDAPGLVLELVLSSLRDQGVPVLAGAGAR
jgi:pimeloyl-ACP methyl ester carboxylesterase